jgi:hypothetical protein
MASMTMSMASSTAAAPAATSSAMSMGGMDMGGSCKISVGPVAATVSAVLINQSDALELVHHRCLSVPHSLKSRIVH